MNQSSPHAGATVALVGPGRAGTAIAIALAEVGYDIVAVAGRRPDAPSVAAAAERFGARPAPIAEAGADADLVLLAPPDAVIGAVAEAIAPGLRAGSLVVHCSGTRGLDELAAIARTRPDVRLGVVHPLQTLPSPEIGAARLTGSWAAVTGPPEVGALVEQLGMHPFAVDDAHRDRYHAAACIASNHLVALLGQVERVAAAAGVPLAAFEPLVRATIDNAFALGPREALTGPVSRGDVETVRRHLAAISAEEQPTYCALADAAVRLVDLDDPEMRELVQVRPR
jgi:predicted short-subunit dehydrogenase-like oxidoreductase (DUF2520 family)